MKKMREKKKKKKALPKMLALDKQNLINNLVYTLHNVQG